MMSFSKQMHTMANSHLT